MKNWILGGIFNILALIAIFYLSGFVLLFKVKRQARPIVLVIALINLFLIILTVKFLMWIF